MNFIINNKKIEQNKNNISFSGVKNLPNLKNEPVFQFVPPPHSKDETVTLEVIPFVNEKDIDPKFSQKKTI